MNLTPNVKQLVILKMSLDAVPPDGGMKSVIDFLLKPNAMKKSFQDAVKFWQEAFVLLRNAKDPNPYKQASDEEIATELMRLIKEKKCRMNGSKLMLMKS